MILAINHYGDHQPKNVHQSVGQPHQVGEKLQFPLFEAKDSTFRRVENGKAQVRAADIVDQHVEAAAEAVGQNQIRVLSPRIDPDLENHQIGRGAKLEN